MEKKEEKIDATNVDEKKEVVINVAEKKEVIKLPNVPWESIEMTDIFIGLTPKEIK